jgi:hypothetical protein
MAQETIARATWLNQPTRDLLWAAFLAVACTALALGAVFGVVLAVNASDYLGDTVILVLAIAGCLTGLVLAPIAMAQQAVFAVTFWRWLLSIRTGRGLIGLLLVLAGAGLVAAFLMNAIQDGFDWWRQRRAVLGVAGLALTMIAVGVVMIGTRHDPA